jgi:protease-4
MKSFLKTLLATIVGIFLSFILLFFLFMMIIGGIVASQKKTVTVKNNSILYLDLDKQIIDRQPASTFNIGQFGTDNRLGLNEILSSIKHAKTDPKISGIYIESSYTEAGYATLDEIRDALIDFRESGKFVISYSEIFTQKAYYITTASDKIFFNPAGMFMLNGLKIKSQFYKNAFEKLGINPVVVKMGKYKGATEQFDQEKMSEPNKEQLTKLIGSIWDNVSAQISSARGINTDTLNKIINDLSINIPENLIKYKLVDSLIYKADVLDYLKNRTSTSLEKDLNSVKISDYANSISQEELKGLSNEKVAVIYASGTILDGEADDDNIGGEKFAREIRKARRDSSIKAIVLRVNSPGGSALASEVILDEIIRTKKVKPIVVSMGDMAASGGYYISCTADSVIANKNTITGSIGVFFRAAYADGFFDKLGITFDIVKTHEHADMFSFTRPYSNTEIAYLQQSIGKTYDLFLNRVSNGRSMKYESVDEIAQGRVWSGTDAQKVGLVDSYGGLKDALNAAKHLANLDDKCQVIELPKQETAFEKLIKDLSGETKFESSLKKFGINSSTITQIEQLFKVQGVVTILPYSIELE